MSDRSSIGWTQATWNPVTGCTKVSPGCERCYAETFAERWRDIPGHYFQRGFDVQLRPNMLDQPLRWRRHRRVFVNSMSDLFHQQVGDDYIAAVFAVMAACPQHTFQLLTKRHARMRALLSSADFRDRVQAAHDTLAVDRPTMLGDDQHRPVRRWPLPNLWVGVSVETQHWADIRVPVLQDTPASVRFLSCEPLLGPIDLTGLLPDPGQAEQPGSGGGLDWVITGGESGRRARPCDPAWVRHIRDTCQAHKIAFFHKQWGGHTTRAGGRQLDGRTWDEYPGAGR
jgi:protein gp37